MDEIEVKKASGFVSMSRGEYEAGLATKSAWDRWFSATPEQRAEWEQQAADVRAYERDAAGPPKPLMMDGLLARLGWSRAYAEHLMQPYCTCDWGFEGWDRCQHARDLNINEY